MGQVLELCDVFEASAVHESSEPLRSMALSLRIGEPPLPALSSPQWLLLRFPSGVYVCVPTVSCAHVCLLVPVCAVTSVCLFVGSGLSGSLALYTLSRWQLSASHTALLYTDAPATHPIKQPSPLAEVSTIIHASSASSLTRFP